MRIWLKTVAELGLAELFARRVDFRQLNRGFFVDRVFEN
jgi:hypothetical protein